VRASEEQIKNGMSFGEEQQLYWNDEELIKSVIRLDYSQLVMNNFGNIKEIARLKTKNDELLTLYTTEREVKDEYKERIKKAIEYLENEVWFSKKEMLEILKGE
jgi:hypothetical protein